MRHFVIAAAVVGCIICIIGSCFIGYSFGKTRELAARIERLEAENQFLKEENLKMKLQFGSTSNGSTSNGSTQSGNLAKNLQTLQPLLQNLFKQYGKSMEIASDLGLPELQGFSSDELAKKIPNLQVQADN